MSLVVDDQQFCLRWNNFQANITSQFETLRDDEDFTDVTIACEGQRLQAHKVVLSACSPFFKELFKTNPCSHPIIFMRDVEAHHIVALMEFMYAGEVNVAQAHLSAFLKTAESLKIRGLTDTAPKTVDPKEDTLYLNPQSTKNAAGNILKNRLNKSQINSSSTVTSSQDIAAKETHSSPPPKRQCKSDTELPRLKQIKEETISVNPFALQNDIKQLDPIQPKEELPDYLSDEDRDDNMDNLDNLPNFYVRDVTELPGDTRGMEIIPKSAYTVKDFSHDGSLQGFRLHRRRMDWLGFDSINSESPLDDEFSGRMKDGQEEDRRNRLIKLGDGIEICEEQLRRVKWSDYRKLTRGLATILFSPAELASCSVTGQRWSRAGSGERPVKPALDKAKVQAIISYVATRFPMVEISRIKQVLAYKCKENSTAFKIKAVSEQQK
ncbi:unnamed protein product [Brassicogethes aeneus]|uniref:Uncharacterized protein n=1 Tax=Brassicogethes aeneus TaxID=1431903 RepID=A0A9P0B2R5_BRAAE|nr:unnamed protein product [Brassicogethes aeneus]